jgi:flagellar biosynthetic protein FliO
MGFGAGDWSFVIGQFFYILFMAGVIILLAFVCAKWAGKRRGQGNIKVLDSCGVGFQSSIQLIKVADRVFLIGITKECIQLLAEITDQAERLAEIPRFTDILGKFTRERVERH